jgi:hypothetical protein
VTTLDTTNHDINWEVNTIGDAGSYARDVSIIGANDIWIVGEFHSTESDTPYNAAHWDGQAWNLVQIPIRNFSGLIYPTRLTAVFAFNSDDVWVFSDAGSYARYNGNSWESEWIEQRRGTILKIWGFSSDQLYFVGTDGSLTKFNGSSFSLMNSGTDINLTDIYGTSDGSEVWACGRETGQRSIILRLRGNVWERIWENQFFSWFTGAALGLYRQSYSNNSVIDHSVFNNQNAFHRVRGSSSNDIIAVGDDAMIWHFNGSSWHWYHTLFDEESVLLSVDVKNNLIVAIGSRTVNFSTNALVFVGRN